MSRFCLPRDIYHGKGSLEELKNLKGKKAILVVGGIVIGILIYYLKRDTRVAFSPDDGVDDQNEYDFNMGVSVNDSKPSEQPDSAQLSGNFQIVWPFAWLAIPESCHFHKRSIWQTFPGYSLNVPAVFG